MGAEYYTELLDPLYSGRKWIIAADAAAGATARAQQMLDAGAAAVMVVAGTAGTGPQPPPGVPVVDLGTTGTTIMEGIRAFATALATPSLELCAAIESFDPAGGAAVVTGYFVPSHELCGRPVWGGAHPEWRPLDDKLIVDDLWDRAGIPRAPSAIVDPADTAQLRRALARFAGDDGGVIVADNREGWHGGGEYARYLAPGADAATTLGFFRRHAHLVRIMPFLRGVPCSIHGLVTSDTVLAFRPVEMLVYRRSDSNEFVYTGMATVWDAPDEIRSQMRTAVRAVGELLRDEVGYRGAFGIDGVCTESGFLPTELNPRLTPGLLMQADAAGGYPMRDIHRAVILGLDIDLRPGELEREIVAGADTSRAGRWHRPLTHLAVSETVDLPIVYDGAGWRRGTEQDATATMSLGPAAQGALVRVALEPDHRLPSGPSVAGIAAASFLLGDEMWETHIGELVPGTAPPP